MSKRDNYNEYMKQYMAKRREERRATLIAMAGGCCADCGSIDQLEFNHIDRATKLFGLDKRGLDKKWETILEEFKKCELLCKMHHQERTAQQYENGEMPKPHNYMQHMPYVHGTMRMYNEKACRCEPCREAKRKYRNKKVSYS